MNRVNKSNAILLAKNNKLPTPNNAANNSPFNNRPEENLVLLIVINSAQCKADNIRKEIGCDVFGYYSSLNKYGGQLFSNRVNVLYYNKYLAVEIGIDNLLENFSLIIFNNYNEMAEFVQGLNSVVPYEVLLLKGIVPENSIYVDFVMGRTLNFVEGSKILDIIPSFLTPNVRFYQQDEVSMQGALVMSQNRDNAVPVVEIEAPLDDNDDFSLAANNDENIDAANNPVDTVVDLMQEVRIISDTIDVASATQSDPSFTNNPPLEQRASRAENRVVVDRSNKTILLPFWMLHKKVKISSRTVRYFKLVGDNVFTIPTSTELLAHSDLHAFELSDFDLLPEDYDDVVFNRVK